MMEKKTGRLDLSLVFIILLFVISVLLRVFFQPCIVNGESMNPTYRDEQIVFALKDEMRRGAERGDVIVANVNVGIEQSELKVIKRVIGIGGDTVQCISNQIFVNGNLVEEDYISPDTDMDDFSVEVPSGYVFLLGDNRNLSFDSRDEDFGCVPEECIYGFVIGQLFK